MYPGKVGENFLQASKVRTDSAKKRGKKRGEKDKNSPSIVMFGLFLKEIEN